MKRQRRAFAGGFLFLLGAYVLPPPLPLTPACDIDCSWQAVLTSLFLKGAQWGTQVVFTYGPWGFLAGAAGSPDVYPWLVAGRLLLALALTAAAVDLAFQSPGPVWARWAFLVLFLLLANPIVLMPCVLALGVLHSRQPLPVARLLLLVAATALSAHVKFTAAIAALLVVGCSTLSDLWDRKLPRVAILFCAGYASLHLLAGQQWANLLPYWRTSAWLSSGYSEAMNTWAPLSTVAPGALLLALGGGAFLLHQFRSAGWSGVLASLWLPPCLLVAFKQAFVRADPYHYWEGMVSFGIPLLLALWIVARPAGRGGYAALWPAFLPAAVAGCVLYASAWGHYGSLWRLRMERLPDFWTGRAAQRHRADQARVREATLALSHAGPIDIYPIDTLIPLVNPVPYAPRPVIQSYTAFGQELLRTSVESLLGPGAPQRILFRPGPIDARYPAFDDSLVWPVLLSHYQLSGRLGAFADLRRRPAPCTVSRQRVSEHTLALGEELRLDLEPGSLYWAEIELGLAPLGRWLNALWRAVPPSMTVGAGKETLEFRFVPGIASAGFLLSPLVETTAEFEALFRPGHGGRTVTRLRLDGPHLVRLSYDPVARVRLHRLVIVDPGESPR